MTAHHHRGDRHRRHGAHGRWPCPARGVVPRHPGPVVGVLGVRDGDRSSGGGVAVTQAVTARRAGPRRPARARPSASWYFPGGTTANADTLFVALLNPTSTPVVVDLGFVTPDGAVHPINYQGIVLQPGQMQVENVASEVQDVGDRHHRRHRPDGPGRGRPRSRGSAGSVGRALPRARVRRARVALDHPPGPGADGRLLRDRRLQPGADARGGDGAPAPGSGPLAPLTDTVPPGTTWVAGRPSTQTRIPDGATYSADRRGHRWARRGRRPDGRAARRRPRRPRPAWPGRGRPEQRRRRPASGSCRRRARARTPPCPAPRPPTWR